jgi:hypothetical protein
MSELGLVNNDRSLVLEYINHLYLVEMLRRVDFKEVSLMTAYTFGMDSNAVWKNDPKMVETFFKTHRDDLTEYNKFKILCSVSKLDAGISKFDTPSFINIPLDPEMINSVLSCLDEALNIHLCNEDAPVGDMAVSRSVRTDRVKRPFDLELVDRLLRNAFDRTIEERKDLDNPSDKVMFGQHRHALLDHRTFFDAAQVKKIVDAINKKYYRASEFLLDLDGVRMMSYIFGILYRLQVPYCMHANRLDRMFEKYILTNDRAAEAVNYARKFSSLSAMDALSCHLLPLNTEYLHTDMFKNHRVVGTYSTDSVVEQYLVTQYLLEKKLY